MECQKTKEAFTFMWKIENIWISIRRTLHSPKFVVEALNKSEWHLELSPGQHYSHEHLACLLQRDDNNAPENIDVKFEISIIPAYGCLPKLGRFSFKKGDSYSCDELALRHGVFQTDHATFTVCCRMWPYDTEFVEAVQCFACSRVEIEPNLKFKWIIEGISSLTVNPSKSVSLASSPEEDGPILTLKMCLSCGTYRVKGFKVQASGDNNERVFMLKLTMFLLDVDEKVVKKDSYFVRIEIDRSDYEWHLPIYIEKNCLKAIHRQNSAQDLLTLLCKCESVVIKNEIGFPLKSPTNDTNI